MTLPEPAYAKLNLALHVRRKRPDGYHDLETLFAFCEVGDELRASLDFARDERNGDESVSLDRPDSQAAHPERSRGTHLTVGGPFADALTSAPDNLVLRAADALRVASGGELPVSLHLTKNLPVASGIGGGSADAAAALRLLNRLWGLDWPVERLAEIGATLGADVAACVWSRTLRGEGRGEVLQPAHAEALAGKPVLLVNPGVAVPTAAVFAAWDGIDRGAFAAGELIGRNDLETPARALQPVIGDVLDLLTAQAGAEAVRMSGSGATCFALFGDDAALDASAGAIAAKNPGWWVAPTRLL